jgi:hypothetical protein
MQEKVGIMDLPMFARVALALLPLQTGSTTQPSVMVQQGEMAGAMVRFIDHHGQATFSVSAQGTRSLQIDIDPRAERQPLLLSVELPSRAQATWAADVEVVDSEGRSLTVRRSGIEWHRLLIPLPAARGTYTVRAVEPPGDCPPVFPDKDREAMEPATGLKATIPRWYDGRRAALSIRFDDSHPTHVSKAIPILREYGFRGTFMICPGGREPNSRRRSDFEDHRAEWEAVAQRRDQEFANHSAHHRGAVGDEDMAAEIGDAAKVIWDLFPGKSKLLALNLGGGTTWETTRTLRYYLDKYHSFDASSGSLGMDDVYGNRPAAFHRQLERHLTEGKWCRIHFHAIGPGLGASEANFRAAMEVAKKYESDLWIAGMADIHKYQTERQATKLAIVTETAHGARLTLSCFTDPALYDQSLTVEVALPSTWSPSEVTVRKAGTHEASVATVTAPDSKAIRFHVLPVTAEYIIEKTPQTGLR